MQEVSKSWKNVHKQTLLNESFVEVTLDIVDPDALADASATDNGAIYLSDTSNVVSERDDVIAPYCTLEQNLWLLDDSREHIPLSSYKDSGYIGEVLSNEKMVFATALPTITINFTQVYTQVIPGITILWGTAYNEYATKFTVTAYNGDSVVAEKLILDNKKVESVVELDISNYDRIVIQVLEWCLPNHRARVDEIFIGWHKVYSKTDLMSYSHKQTVDPISTALPKAETKFSIDNSDGSYNPYNLNGLSKYLTERQKVKTRYGLKLNDNSVEWIDGGMFYLSEWYAKQNGVTADFVARDILEFMSVPYKDTISEVTERNLYDMAVAVLMSAKLPLHTDGKYNWVVDEELKKIKTNAPLPDDTVANCLQMIANAGKCVIYVDRSGRLHIERIEDKLTDYEINSFNSYSKPEIALSKSLKSVVVKCYTYAVGDKGFESSTSDVMYAIADEGEIITVDNPLITSEEMATDVGQWVGNYLKNRMTVKADVRVDVRLDALDKVTNTHTYGTNDVRVTDVEFKFNGAFHGTAEGRVI